MRNEETKIFVYKNRLLRKIEVMCKKLFLIKKIVCRTIIKIYGNRKNYVYKIGRTRSFPKYNIKIVLHFDQKQYNLKQEFN